MQWPQHKGCIKIFFSQEMAADDLAGRAEQISLYNTSDPEIFLCARCACSFNIKGLTEGEGKALQLLYASTMQHSVSTVCEHEKNRKKDHVMQSEQHQRRQQGQPCPATGLI